VPSQVNSSSTVSTTSGASGGRSSTTRKGTTRKKWTDDEYRELLWCYFYSIHSFFPKSGYEARMHDIWLQRNPEKQFTKLYLSNQRRTIISHNLILEPIRNQIKQTVDTHFNLIAAQTTQTDENTDNDETIIMSEQTIQNIELQLAEISSQEQLQTETTETTELPTQMIN
jgi:hypothetical protein